MSSSSASPPRSRNHHGEERPRYFDQKAKNECWSKAEIVFGRHPERWRKDAAGNIVCKRFCNCSGCLCFEYDHIVPFSKGLIFFCLNLFLFIFFYLWINFLMGCAIFMPFRSYIIVASASCLYSILGRFCCLCHSCSWH